MRRLTNEQMAAAKDCCCAMMSCYQVAVTATLFGIKSATHPEDDIVLATAVGARKLAI
jgi:hypothetical protein